MLAAIPWTRLRICGILITVLLVSALPRQVLAAGETEPPRDLRDGAASLSAVHAWLLQLIRDEVPDADLAYLRERTFERDLDSDGAIDLVVEPHGKMLGGSPLYVFLLKSPGYKYAGRFVAGAIH